MGLSSPFAASPERPRNRALERQVLDERLAGDDDAGGMGAGVAGDALQLLGSIDQAAHRVVEVVKAAQLDALGEGPLDGHVEGVRDHAGHAVDLGVSHAEGTAERRGWPPWRPWYRR